jgi:hypothetical protein
MDALPINLPAKADLTPSPKSIPKKMKVESSVDKLDKQLADMKGTLNPLNTAGITEYMRLTAERDRLKEKLRPVQGAASAQETNATEPFKQIAKSGFFKGPEDVQGPATQAENDAASQYQRIGNGGFFKEPDALPAAPAVEAKALPVAGVPLAALSKDTIKPGEPPAIDNAEPIADKKVEAVMAEKPGFDFAGMAKKLGVGIAELVNAYAMGQAGVTDMSQLATGQRLAREGEATKLAAAQSQADKELAAQAKKDDLDRAYQAEQQAIQNQFTIDRDAKGAQDAADAADAKYQHDLGLINAELTANTQKAAAQKRGESDSIFAQALRGMVAERNGSAGLAQSAAGAPVSGTISASQAQALEAKRRAEAAKRGKN